MNRSILNILLLTVIDVVSQAQSSTADPDDMMHAACRLTETANRPNPAKLDRDLIESGRTLETINDRV